MSAAIAEAAVGKRTGRQAGPKRTRRIGSSRPLGFVLGLSPLVLGLILWEVFGDPTSFTFPPPSQWWTAAQGMHQEGLLVVAVWRTMLTFLLGLAISVFVGVVLGWAIGASRRVELALSPLLDFFRSMPSPALVPIATVIFGVSIGMSAIVMLIAIVWPVLLATVTARQTIPPVRLEMGRVLGLSTIDQLRKVVFPSLLPAIMTGTRVAVSQGFVIALLIDIIGSGAGVGRLLVVRQQTFDAASVWALLVVIGLFGLVANGVVAILDHRVQKGWRS
ncbi:hypothetical protein ASG73_03460 [Janibacter sp. Soil728]|uniref:ABC transporter permease n=1 Tax=Janibacter sp. Soil728 TaxID=1736393 RepID=UPI0006F3F63A|nr:ABC transporter permease [Janibacter sp. Soil728]KRE39392.1 hypothetical protein ASG73_03460 [Janibacter sp. Soil728]